jgi:hypothetical protein
MSDSIRKLARALADTSKSDDAWGDARSRLWKELEVGLRNFVKEHPPGLTRDYQAHEPARAYWLYRDAVLENLRDDDLVYRVVEEVLDFSRGAWEKTAKLAIAAIGQRGRTDDKMQVTERFPEYPGLLSEIREAKKTWTEADREIKKTHAFRMMGGLARMGTREGGRYNSLVERAQRMEREVLGKELTKRTRASG